MKERLTALLMALAALGLFWAIFFPKPRPVQDVVRPLSTEAGTAGYRGLWRWLDAEGIAIVSLRNRYDRLAVDPGVPRATGNLLLSTMPHLVPIRDSELADLDSWIRKGNTLLVMAALDDTPRWSLANENFLDRLRRATRMGFEVEKDSRQPAFEATGAVITRALKPAAPALAPLGSHPLLAGVKSLATASDLPASRWNAVAMDSSPVLELAKRSDTGEPALWLRSLGAGSIIVSAYASPLSNGRIAAADNAAWFANVVAWSLGPEGRVIFDDVHQGAVDYYDAAAFYADPRLHRTLWWIVGVWLIYVLGSRPLRIAVAGVRPLDDTAMLRVTGRFLANVLRPAAAGQRLFEFFFNGLRRRLGLPETGAPLWEWLEAQAPVTREQLAELQMLHARVTADRSINLVRLQTLLSDTSGRLQ